MAESLSFFIAVMIISHKIHLTLFYAKEGKLVTAFYGFVEKDSRKRQ